MRRDIYLVPILLAAGLAWGQGAASDADTNPVAQDRMIVPAPVSGEPYSVAMESQESSNYLHYGVALSGAYSDNVLGGATGHAVSDMSYSIWPTIGLDQTTPRLHWGLTYAPGFTFYQRTSQRNEADQNALLTFQYRLSPHVTLSARESFQKSSSVFNQPNLGLSGSVSGGTQETNLSVIAPLASFLSNVGNAGLTYQFGANDMVGGSAGFTNLHYADSSQVAGLSDGSSQTGTAFYSHRIAKRHYLGAAYQYQRLMTYPSGLSSETQTHATMFFYSVVPSARLSLSLFAGPQYADTDQPALSTTIPAFTSRLWTPIAGTSLNYRGPRQSAAFSYSHVVSGGSGLMGAVRLDQAGLTVRRRFTRFTSGSLGGFYANNNMIAPSAQSNNGHTFSGTVAVERNVSEYLSFQAGYSRIHQTYSIPVFAATPNTNREFISIVYDFSRPLGR